MQECPSPDLRNEQTLPYAILTVAWDGAMTAFSPELIDASSKENGDFIWGTFFTIRYRMLLLIFNLKASQLISMLLFGSRFLDRIPRSEAQLYERHSLRRVRARTKTESLVQVENCKRNEVAAALQPNCSLSPDLHFGVARDTYSLAPLVGAVPKKLVRANNLLAMVVQAHIPLHREPWQFEDVGFRYRPLEAGHRFLLIDCVGCADVLAKRSSQDEQIEAALHRRSIKQSRKGSV